LRESQFLFRSPDGDKLPRRKNDHGRAAYQRRGPIRAEAPRLSGSLKPDLDLTFAIFAAFCSRVFPDFPHFPDKETKIPESRPLLIREIRAIRGSLPFRVVRG
jgi:hypothetical protein